MKHLRKFNEAEEPKKYEMTLKDYFYDFSDNGFTIDVEDNMVIGKYIGEYGFEAAFDMYQDAITKLTHYFDAITRTSFDYKKSVVNFTIQVKNKINDADSIEIETKKGKIILKPNGFAIYTNGSTKPNSSISNIVLFSKDENNRSYNITWEPDRKGPNYISSSEHTIVRAGSSNVKIDLVNAGKIYNMILNNIIPHLSYYTQDAMDMGEIAFSKSIKPEFLSKV